MKKLFIQILTLCLLTFIPITVFNAIAHALPTAEVSMDITDVEEIDNDFIFTLDIAVTASSEPYASLDFNLVTSNYDTLSIIDLNEDPEVTELDIDFTLKKAYHQGQEDPDTGHYRYLMGIFTQAAGNGISDGMTICSARLRYSGDEPQTLRVQDMKLVYVNSVGGVASNPVISDNAILSVDRDLLSELAATLSFFHLKH